MRIKNKQLPAHFEFSLKENAKSSLIQAIRHFTTTNEQPADLKFSVIHIFHAVELFLKERLVREHPLLIYDNPGCRITEQSQTVRFDELIKRLRNSGVHLTVPDIQDLSNLKDIRNGIEHFKISKPKADVKDYVGKAAKFLEKFLQDELHLSLERLVGGQRYAVLSESIHSYEERLARAKEKLERRLPGDGGRSSLDSTVDNCPECGEETLSTDVVDSKGLAECFFCHTKFYFQDCPRCGKTIYSTEKFTEDNDPGVCDDCWDYKMSED